MRRIKCARLAHFSSFFASHFCIFMNLWFNVIAVASVQNENEARDKKDRSRAEWEASAVSLGHFNSIYHFSFHIEHRSATANNLFRAVFARYASIQSFIAWKTDDFFLSLNRAAVLYRSFFHFGNFIYSFNKTKKRRMIETDKINASGITPRAINTLNIGVWRSARASHGLWANEVRGSLFAHCKYAIGDWCWLHFGVHASLPMKNELHRTRPVNEKIWIKSSKGIEALLLQC